MGNGDANSGEGYKYRGRGIIQLTGKDNYKNFSQDVFGDNTVLDNPDTITINKAIAVHSACWFWKRNNINILADKDDCLAITKKINGTRKRQGKRKEQQRKQKRRKNQHKQKRKEKQRANKTKGTRKRQGRKKEQQRKQKRRRSQHKQKQKPKQKEH